jgi:outer membrane autotransporter protein
MTKTLKRNLLATASVLALGAFSAGVANAAAITATGGSVADATLDGNITLLTAATNTGADTTTTIILNSASTLTTSSGAGVTRTGATGAAGDAITTSGTATAATNVTNVDGSTITSDTGNSTNTIDINNAIGTITNLGTIAGSANNGTVIDMGAASVLVNGNLAGSDTGTISANGTGTAVVVSAGITGSITNYTGSSILSTGASTTGVIDINAILTGALTNAGSITSTGAGIGIDVGANITGGLINSSTGIINTTTTGKAINISASTLAALTNAGTIQATGGNAINLANNTTNVTLITNSAGGLINDVTTGAGINFVGANTASAVANSGTISATTTGNAIIVGGALTSDNANGTIYNSSTGVMSAAASTNGVIDINAAIVNSTTAGKGINNAGTIRDTGNGSAINVGAGVGIYNTGTISGAGATATILQSAANTNASGISNIGGTISNSSTGSAIQITTGAMTGAITNTAGTISSTGGDTISLAQNTGGIANTGTISSAGAAKSAVHVTAASATTITNTGSTSKITSAGTVGTILVDGFTLTGAITNGGTISNTFGAAGAGDAIDSGSATGTLATGIVNTGTISTTNTGAAAAIRTGAITANGIVNTGGLITTAGSLGAITLVGDVVAAGGITNTGTISSTYATAGSRVAIDRSAQTTAGVIVITNSGTITGEVKLGKADTFTQTAGATSVTSGTVILGTAGDETLNIYGGTITGNIDLAAGNDTINFGNATADAITIAGTMNGKVLNSKFGTTTLTGAYTGVAGSTITVDNGSTLYVKSNSTNLAATAVSGTLQIASGNTLTAGTNTTLAGTLKLDFTPVDTTTGTQAASTFGRYASSGALTMSGTGGININVVGTGYTKAQTIASVVTAGSLAGTYVTGAALADNSYVLDFTQVTNGTNIDIAITRANTLTSASTAVNESSVGAALETIAATGDAGLDALQGSLQGLSTAAAVSSALETLTPDVSGAVTSAAFAASDAGLGVIGGRMDEMASIDGTGVATGSSSYRSGVWGQAFGTAADQDDRDGVRGYQSDTGGFALGADTMINDQMKLGASLAYANTSADSANGEVDIDSYQGTVYGTYDMGQWFTNALLGFTEHNFDSTRNIAVALGGGQADGEFDGQQYTAKIGGGYKMKIQGGLQVTPLASLMYTHLALDDYTETGAAALAVDNSDVDVLKSELGFKLAYPIVDGGITYVPAIRGSWFYDFIGDEQETSSSFTSVPTVVFATQGADIAQSSFDLGLGLDVMAQDNVTVSFDYDLISKEDYISHNGSIKARLAF